MKKYMLAAAFLILATAADAESFQDPALAKAVQEKFPEAVMLTQSTKCIGNASGPLQVGIILQQKAKLHAAIATSSANDWVISDLPRGVEYKGGAMADFLDEFDSAEARKDLGVRCTNPKTDADINVNANGAFIAHRGEQVSAHHLCFPASAVYNSWVCYWTEPNSTKPKLSFVQFNAD